MTKYYIRKGINGFIKKVNGRGKELTMIKGSGISLTDNEIKNTMKVINVLKNSVILLKGTTKTITSQESGFLSFLGPLMATALPLRKNVLTFLAKSVLARSGLATAVLATDAATLFRETFLDQKQQ